MKHSKEFRTVWWEARALKIWTWSPDLSADLLRACAHLLRLALIPDKAAQCGQHGYHQHTFQQRPVCHGLASDHHTTGYDRPARLGARGMLWEGSADVCEACTQCMLEWLRVDYKCIDLAVH